MVLPTLTYQSSPAEKVEAVRCDGAEEAVEGVFLLRPAMAPGDLFPGLETGGGFVAVDRTPRPRSSASPGSFFPRTTPAARTTAFP